MCVTMTKLATDGWQASLLMIFLFHDSWNKLKHTCCLGTKAQKIYFLLSYLSPVPR